MNNVTIDVKSFDAIAKLAYDESGLQLVAEKTSMIQSRLRHRLKALSIGTFGEYVDLVCSPDGESERRQMIAALTTNVSHFFRENHHFEILIERIIPRFLDAAKAGGRFRIWSAGCSNGQEAYSVMMAVANRYPELLGLDFKILATDIDPNVIEFAKAGIYPERLVSGVPKDMLAKFFERGTHKGEESFAAKPLLKSNIAFKELNLLSNWPIKSEMHVIFCRNVVIYFDIETQNRLWPRFREQLNSDGVLFLGHSERIADPDRSGFVNDGPTTYSPS